MVNVLKPELISFAATKEEIIASIKAGITHIILDDPSISIRSFAKPKDYDNLLELKQLISWTKNKFPNIVVSVNCDGLYHSNEDELIPDLKALVKEVSFDYLRIQDIGILQEMHTLCKCVLDVQMGNCNWVSMNTYKEFAKRQVVSMDVAYKDSCEINEKVATSLECYVHSRILLQYSKRRFMLGSQENDPIKNEKLDQIYKLAQDEDYPGRRFSFLDNQHGHFMFAYFDRCLLTCIKELNECKFTGWIIDNRGCNWDYHLACITAYKKLINHDLNTSDIRQELNQLATLSERPLKPGFFKINQTDKRRYKKINMFANENEYPVARVLDTIKKKRITLEVTAPISIGDTLIARHPKIDQCRFEITTIWDLNNSELTHAEAGMLIQIPWQKYIQQQAIIVKENV